jgi:predicted component of type VI protein secretion system
VVIAGAAPQMFRVRRYTDLGQLRDVGRLFESARYARWNSFRDKLDASYVGLVLPRVALHTVLPLFPGRPQGGEVATDATDDHVVWGNGAFAVGSALIDCFRFNGWFADLLEGTADSAIRGLAKLEAVDEFGGALQSSLEVNVPRRHRLQLADQGFIALWQRPHADECTLPDLVSCRRIGSPTSAPRSLPSADEAPSSDDDLRQKLALSRLISHIKAIGRVKRPGELEEYLQNWRRSLIKPDGVSDVGGMIQPFEDLHLEFRHEFGRIRVVPHVIHRVAPRARADRP